MKRGTAFFLRTRLLAGLLTIAALFATGSGDLLAQCTSYVVTSNAGCAVRIVVGPPTSPTYYTIPPGTPVSLPPGATLLGVANACGTITSFATTCGSSVLSEYGCCVFACVDPTTCTITITPAAYPCPC